ncbi:hypothetical protein, partial [Shewanella chilikensis]|uniref:hypothetical protein n=1 Tax=Shewanella chilikensis TaxID=558541 RepID=UPI00399B4249
CIKKSDDMGSSDFDPFSEIVKRSVLTDRHYAFRGLFYLFPPSPQTNKHSVKFLLPAALFAAYTAKRYIFVTIITIKII